MSTEENEINGGVISRLSAAWREMRFREERKSINPLQVYEPYSIKSLPHPQSNGYNSVPVYSSWSSWDNALSGRFAGSKLDYASLVGDLSQSSLVMSAVRWLGNIIPSARLTVQETKGDKDEENLDHNLPKLWYRPNKFYSGSTLIKGFAYSWILNGNAYQRKVWNQARTEVVELWYEPHYLIRPRWMGDNQGSWLQPTRDDVRDSHDDFISYYEIDRNNQKYRLEVSDVIHFRDGFDPSNIRLGLSRIGAILREVYGDNEAANYAARLAGGSGVPPFVLSFDKELELDQPTIDGMEARLYRKTSGDQRGRPMVVTGGKVEKMGVDPDKMDLRGSHRFSEERFSAVTGIPAVALELGAGHEHSIYNNVKQADERAYEAYLLPLYKHMEEELNIQLLEDFEGEQSKVFCKFDLSEIRALQEDEDAKHRRVWGDYSNGVITLAEARSVLNYEVKPEQENTFSPKVQPTMTNQPAKSEIKSVPPDEDIDAAKNWWDKAVPEAKGLIDAPTKGKANGDGKVLNG